MRKEKAQMEPTREEIIAVCVQYYIDKGYTEEHATAYVLCDRSDRELLKIHRIIQEEKEYLKNHPIDEPAAVFPL